LRTIGCYEFPARDVAEAFTPDQLVFVHFDDDTCRFCAPAAFRVSPEVSFSDFLEQMVRPWLGSWPELAGIDFGVASYMRDQLPFQPEPEESLGAQGLGHKVLLTIRPGL